MKKKSVDPKKLKSRNVVSGKTSYIQKRSAEYDAAGNGRRSTGWGNTNPGPNNALTIGGLDVIRRRARDAARNNPWAASALHTIETNIVGLGIKPMINKNKALMKLWNQWIEQADADGATNFYGLQTLVARSVAEGGDCFARIRPRRLEDGLAVPLQVQVLEAEMVPSVKNQLLSGGRKIVGGIEFDAIGKRVLYHMLRSHPGDLVVTSMDTVNTVPVPAESVCHIYTIRRPGQVRGYPWLTTALTLLHELDIYNDAEMMRKKTAAMFGGFIHTPGTDDDSEVLQSLGAGGEVEEDVYIEPLEPGTFPVLPPGYEVKFSQPADIGGSYDVFVKSQLRAIAQAVGLTYEQLTGDLSGVNERLIRISLLEFKRRCEQWQWNMMISQFCMPVWKAFVDLAILSGAYVLQNNETAEDLYEVDWTPHRWEYVNPEQEIGAKVKEIRAGLTSRARAVSERGDDVEDLDIEIARDNARADKLGLVFDSDARKDNIDIEQSPEINAEDILNSGEEL